MSSLALKTVINELPTNATSLVSTICKRVTDRLSEAIVKVSRDTVVVFTNGSPVPFSIIVICFTITQH